jgi:hypothetical protein
MKPAAGANRLAGGQIPVAQKVRRKQGGGAMGGRTKVIGAEDTQPATYQAALSQ